MSQEAPQEGSEQEAEPAASTAGDEPKNDYKIDLENFSGPLDLLLYLIRKEEVDIYDIPIGRVLGQYMSYLELIKAIDLDEAGEFLVMASTLMVIKSKLLLPVEEVDLAEELDPRYELVQQLLEYKNIKVRSQALEERARKQFQRYPRPESARPETRIEQDRSLDELQIWDLFQFFEKVMAETTIHARVDRVIEGRQVPVREFAAQIEERLVAGPLSLSRLFAEEKTHAGRIGYFLAILLLAKSQAISLKQADDFGDIELHRRENREEDNIDQEIELADDFRD